MRTLLGALVVVCSIVLPQPAFASDHADPAAPAVLDPQLSREPNIAGLFVFPKDDRLEIIYTVYADLSVGPPYLLEDYEFVVFMDLDSEIDFSDEEIRARYAGHVVRPEAIEPEVTITIELNADATLAAKRVEGLRDPESIRWYTGVRDDPFIFTPFFGKNIIAMAMSIPLTAFPDGQQDWILWGNTRERGSSEILDHVGRGLRTQLPRFGFLNTLPPSEHIAAIEEQAHKSETIGEKIMRYLAPVTNLWEYVAAIRYYDLEPDVCIYTSRYPAGFPNGRRLEDDIAAISCEFGECILVELAITEGMIWPRPTVNDKELLPDFPYLADPWPETPADEVKKPWIAPQTVVKLVVAAVVLLLLLNLFLLLRCWRRSRASD